MSYLINTATTVTIATGFALMLKNVITQC